MGALFKPVLELSHFSWFLLSSLNQRTVSYVTLPPRLVTVVTKLLLVVVIHCYFLQILETTRLQRPKNRNPRDLPGHQEGMGGQASFSLQCGGECGQGMRTPLKTVLETKGFETTTYC